jgi:ATP-dependent helicase/nuclease subunit B
MPYLRVTHFSGYLACPFRFFLKSRLRMEPVEFEKEEMDPRDFGTLVHLALEALYDEDWARGCTDAGKLRNLLVDALDRVVADRYGTRLPAPLAMQREVARQRLGRAAEIQAAERAGGWVIEAVEHDFGAAPEWGSSLAGIPVHGSVDRIERHHDGRVRILDYKTSKVAVSPEDAHLDPLPRGTGAADFPDWRTTAGSDGKPRLWTNLQLPLYVLWARSHFPEATSVSPGYFNLPAALGNTGISTWETGHFGSVIGSAEACAAAVGEAVRNNVFWPPETKVSYDDFSVLAPVGTLEEAVDADAWQAAFATLAK